MTRLAQILCVLFVVVLGGAGLMTILNPVTMGETSGFNPVGAYGLTNVRTLGAPTLTLAIVTAIGALRKDWLLILPASLYFLLNGLARTISVLAEGYEPVMLRGLLLTTVLFALSQVALHIFRRTKGIHS
ncbi:hypothetical protein [Candidatus Leptofilum sp.]|uniref:hypothetical protein n=1 Tax=Candidatus Leptofilum sp. TaxID=3241576 RepID=UPI003B595C25